MEVEYENRVHAETAPHPVCARLQRLILNGRPELMTVQEVFSRSYKMLMKHKGMEKLLLDVPFNLCLLLVEKRPAFLIQAVDYRSASLHKSIDTCLRSLSGVFATIDTYQGQLVCLKSRAGEIRQAVLNDGSCSCFGRILGYPFAGELDEIHCCSGRFRVNLKISTCDMERENGQAASFMAMVGCQNHCVSDVMKMAMDFQAVASEISPALRISFGVDLYNDDPRERPPSCLQLKENDSPGGASSTEHHAECSLGHVAPCHWPSQAGRAFEPSPSQGGTCHMTGETNRGALGSKTHSCTGFLGKRMTSEPRVIIANKKKVREQQPCTVTPREREGWRMK